jgi:hypothetical protein
MRRDRQAGRAEKEERNFDIKRQQALTKLC